MAALLFATCKREIEGGAAAKCRVVRHQVLSFTTDDRPDFGITRLEHMLFDASGFYDFNRF